MNKIDNYKFLVTDEADFYLYILENGEWHIHIDKKKKLTKTVYEKLFLYLLEVEEYLKDNGMTDTIFTVTDFEDNSTQRFVSMFGFEACNTLLHPETKEELYLQFKKEL
jgi:actin-related protein